MFGRFLCFKDTIKNSYRQIDCHAGSRLAWAAAGLLSAVEAHCFAMRTLRLAQGSFSISGILFGLRDPGLLQGC